MKNFSNPWGNKGNDYKRWYTNKWIEGGEYYDTLYANSNNENASDGDEEEDTGPVKILIRHPEVSADDPDFTGLKILVATADSLIPRLLKQHAESALASIGDNYFSVEVFEEFDRKVKYDFSRNYFPGQNPNDTDISDNQQDLVIVVATEFIAALRYGSDSGFRDKNGNSNTLAKNYKVRRFINEFGLESTEHFFVQLYDAKPIDDGGIMTRYFPQYKISLELKNRFIFMNFTIGQLAVG